MNKRSAFAIAGGLVAALLAGVVVFSLTTGSATTVATAKQQKPIVRTVKRTKTIHKKAENQGKGGGVITVVRQAPSSGSANVSSGSGYGDDGYEHESEGYGHESEGSGESGGGGGSGSGGGDGGGGSGDD